MHFLLYFTITQVRQFKEKQAKEKFKKEKERKRAAAEVLERHRGNKESMRAISRNLKTTKSADKSVLDVQELERRERERDKDGLRDQGRHVYILVEIHSYHSECINMALRVI